MGRARGARAVVSLVPLIPCHRARPPTSEARLGPPCHTWNGTGLADPQGQQAQEVGGNAVGRGGCAQKEGRRVFSTLQSSRVLAWARARTFTLTDMPTSKRKHATTQRTRMDSCLRTRTDTSTQSSTCRTDSTLRPHRQKGRGWDGMHAMHVQCSQALHFDNPLVFRGKPFNGEAAALEAHRRPSHRLRRTRN